MPEVSVIMSTYNESEIFLRTAIESILNQTFHDFEYIIILDNPKNTEHYHIVSEYQKKDSRIKLYTNEKNLGLTASLNKGLSVSKGKYICRMDADDISLSSRIEEEKKYLENNNYDLVGGITQVIDENNQPIYSIKKVPTDLKKIKKALKYNQVIAHPTWFGKKELFEKLNGYRQIPLCEDYDFTLRAVLNGYKISNINKVVLRYRMTSSSISRNNLYEQFLFAEYITKEYKNKHITDVQEAKKYVQKKVSLKKSQKYTIANTLFNDALKNLENHQYIQLVKHCFELLFTSQDYLKKIYRLVMVTLYS